MLLFYLVSILYILLFWLCYNYYIHYDFCLIFIFCAPSALMGGAPALGVRVVLLTGGLTCLTSGQISELIITLKQLWGTSCSSCWTSELHLTQTTTVFWFRGSKSLSRERKFILPCRRIQNNTNVFIILPDGNKQVPTSLRVSYRESYYQLHSSPRTRDELRGKFHPASSLLNQFQSVCSEDEHTCDVPGGSADDTVCITLFMNEQTVYQVCRREGITLKLSLWKYYYSIHHIDTASDPNCFFKSFVHLVFRFFCFIVVCVIALFFFIKSIFFCYADC